MSNGYLETDYAGTRTSLWPLEVVALDLEGPVHDAGSDAVGSTELDLGGDISGADVDGEADGANEGVRGPLGVATSGDVAVVIAGGSRLGVTKENGSSDYAVVIGSTSHSLCAESGDVDGTINGSPLAEGKGNGCTWEINPGGRGGLPAICAGNDVSGIGSFEGGDRHDEGVKVIWK